MQIGAVSRIPGITPAAIVNLLRFVKTNHQKTEKLKMLAETGNYLPGKMYLEKATSQRQVSAEFSEEEPESAFVTNTFVEKYTTPTREHGKVTCAHEHLHR